MRLCVYGGMSAEVLQAEQVALDTITGMKGRGSKGSDEQQRLLAEALAVLEEDGGVADPVLALGTIQGNWRLLYTSKSKFDVRNPLGKRVDGSAPGLEAVGPVLSGMFGDAVAKGMEASSSPIQRTVTAVDAFDVEQNVTLTGGDPRVDQLVKFGNKGVLRLSAAASTTEGNTQRIDFTFDLAYFESPLLPFRIPYPVPFRLLGDEAKGWLDTVYLSERMRISKGNKGTTFILKRID